MSYEKAITLTLDEFVVYFIYGNGTEISTTICVFETNNDDIDYIEKLAIKKIKRELDIDVLNLGKKPTVESNLIDSKEITLGELKEWLDPEYISDLKGEKISMMLTLDKLASMYEYQYEIVETNNSYTLTIYDRYGNAHFSTKVTEEVYNMSDIDQQKYIEEMFFDVIFTLPR